MSEPKKPTATEEELSKIDALISQHTVSDVLEGQSSQFRFSSSSRSAPSGGYRCHRCGEAGHFIQDCPQGDQSGQKSIAGVKTRQARGIPKTFLESITEAEAAKRGLGAFVSAEGELVVMKGASTEERLRLVGPSIDIALQRSFGGSCWEQVKKCLYCYICQEVVKDPVIVTCCGELFCRSCILRHLDKTITDFSKDSIVRGCPQCDKTGLNPHTDIVSDMAIASLLASFSGTTLSEQKPIVAHAREQLPTAPKRARMELDIDEGLTTGDQGTYSSRILSNQKNLTKNTILVPGGSKNPFFSDAPDSTQTLLSEPEFIKWKQLYRDALIQSGLEPLLAKRGHISTN